MGGGWEAIISVSTSARLNGSNARHTLTQSIYTNRKVNQVVVATDVAVAAAVARRLQRVEGGARYKSPVADCLLANYIESTFWSYGKFVYFILWRIEVKVNNK